MSDFRVFFQPADFARSLAFYRDALGLAMVHSWDKGPADRGAVFALGAGRIEIVVHPPASPPPAGVGVYVEVPDVDAVHAAVRARGVAVTRPLARTSWGHRTFGVRDPDGLEILWFSPLAQSTAFAHVAGGGAR